MDFEKIILIGLIAGFIAFIAGSILYMNPMVAGIYAENTWAGSKSMDLFGGTMNWMLLMLVGGLVAAVFVAFLYSYTEKGITLKPAWKKGLFFGFLLWLVVTVPTAYYTWLMNSYPNILNIIEVFNGLIGNLVTGLVIAVLFERLK